MKDRVVNFSFHGIGTPRSGEEKVWLPVEFFRTVLDSIGESKRVRLSFDDGNTTDTGIVLPELQKRNLKATFFIVAGRIDSGGYLSRNDICSLVSAGMTIGAHGMRHIRWRALTDQSMHEEFFEAKRALEEVTGAPVNQVACPHGEYDRKTLAGLRHAGFSRIYTSDGGYAAQSWFIQPRNSIWISSDIAQIRSMINLESNYRNEMLRILKRFVKRYR